eukprot:324448_1
MGNVKTCTPVSRYNEQTHPSHFIQFTEVTHKQFTIRLIVMKQSVSSKSRVYTIKDTSNDNNLGTLILPAEATLIDHTFVFNYDEYTIAVFDEWEVKVSNSLNIKRGIWPLPPNYKPPSINANAIIHEENPEIIKIFDKDKSQIQLYWNTPSGAFGQIEYKIYPVVFDRKHVIPDVYLKENAIEEYLNLVVCAEVDGFGSDANLRKYMTKEAIKEYLDQCDEKKDDNNDAYFAARFLGEQYFGYFDPFRDIEEKNKLPSVTIKALPLIIPLETYTKFGQLYSIKVVTICRAEHTFASNASDPIHINFELIEQYAQIWEIIQEMKKSYLERTMCLFKSSMEEKQFVNKYRFQMVIHYMFDQMQKDPNFGKLQTLYNQLKEQTNGDDEKKENEFTVQAMQKRLEMLEQFDRFNMNSTDVMKDYNECIKKYDAKSISNSKEYEEYEEYNLEYETSKQRRAERRKKIQLDFAKCNKMIRKENELFEKLKAIKNKQNEIDKQVVKLKLCSRSCMSVMQSYEKFMDDGKQCIDKINVMFNKAEDEFESKYMKWNVKDIIL